MKKKSVPLPCTDEQYKTIKMFCLVNGLKYADLTRLLVKIVKDVDNNDKTRNNNV
ncbi:MAG: hypothetical protein ACRCXT_21040 [Paraclostridium sp.]